MSPTRDNVRIAKRQVSTAGSLKIALPLALLRNLIIVRRRHCSQESPVAVSRPMISRCRIGPPDTTRRHGT